jgi:glycine/D-amino acid oxidase-like deaminating enzyme
MEHAPPWFRERSDLSCSDPLPPEADVVIVGGGLAGCAVASFLGSTRTLVLEARPFLADGIAGRGHGLVLEGLADAPGRLTAALGDAGAGEVFRFGQENAALASALGVFQTTLLRFSMGETEIGGLGDDMAALDRLGINTYSGDGGPLALGPARTQGTEGWVEPLDLVRKLRPASFRTGIRVQAIDDGLVVRTDRGTVRAETVVIAAGHSAVEPWLADKLFPVRMQMVAITKRCAAFSAQFGHLYGRPYDGGGVVGGARWATQHLEEGETDDTVVEPRVHARLEAFVREWFPDAEITHAWSAIATHTCDGLPIVGPIPGRGRVIACTGWGGLDCSFALRAARAVADGILTGKAAGVPRTFEPSRLV